MWNFAQRALPFDRRDRHVATVLAGVRRTHGRPPVQQEALLPEHVLAMPDLISPPSLRNLRDRAILLLGFAGGPPSRESLDCALGAGSERRETDAFGVGEQPQVEALAGAPA